MKKKIPNKVIQKRFRRRIKSKRKKALLRKKNNESNKNEAVSYSYKRSRNYENEPIAPANFSFSKNENGVLKFISKLENYLYKKQSVFVRLNNIIQIDQEAVVLLLGIMAEFKASEIKFNGNFPKSSVAQKILIDSGFLKRLFPKNVGYSFGTKHGIYTHGQKVYDENSSSEALSEAMTCVFGVKKRSQGARRVLLEAMKNTIAHASPNQKKRHWWLLFNKDATNKKLIVSMLDYGVGIFKSLSIESPDNPGYLWYERNLKLGFSNQKLLKKIMNGELKGISRTRQSQHGTGLPGMKTAFENQFISKLVIVSNDVYADISNNQYRTLDTSFSGTLIQFEICEKCKSFPYE